MQPNWLLPRWGASTMSSRWSTINRSPMGGLWREVFSSMLDGCATMAVI
jgi:hypothetical protein